uniref:Cytochrome b561 domain-containing protein n=1 Tax=Acrobeloides nanus TaxID=290746 RepID=A0A914D5V2_9BILA
MYGTNGSGLQFGEQAYDNNEKRIHNYTNMFSFHSWIGVSIIAAYGIQAIIGFVSFVFPKIRMDFREAVMPFHRFLGRIIFATSVAQALIGNSMYWFFTFETGAQGISCYYDLACPKHVGVILNFYVITMVCYAICVGLMIGKDSWRRQPTLDEKKNQ